MEVSFKFQASLRKGYERAGKLTRAFANGARAAPNEQRYK